MTLILSRSGLLHASARCAGSGYTFTLHEGMELLEFVGLRFERFCRVCLGEPA